MINICKIRKSHKTFVNKAPFPSHVYKRTTLLISWKLEQSINNKNDKIQEQNTFLMNNEEFIW